MQVKSLKITNVRVFERAEFEFQPGMNLLVGINGAGKSTVLDVLRIMFSKHLPQMVRAGNHRLNFEESDIHQNRPYMLVELEFEVGGNTFIHTHQLPSKSFSETKKINQVSPKMSTLPSEEYRNALVVFFSPRRSLVLDKEPSAAAKKGGTTAAYADALRSRELKLRELVRWWAVQDQLGREDSRHHNRLSAIIEIALSFLQQYTDISLDASQQSLCFKKPNGQEIDVRQLSDGERNVLALILDLSRRLVLANDETDDPLSESKALVIIDELDLHLHPNWQRTIVDRLTETFPSCQFIATTHSPLIFGEVKPERIILIDNGTANRPSQSLGMDTNWILRHLMGVTERETDTKQELDRIEKLIEDENYDAATEAIESLRSTVGDFPELVSLQTRIDMFDFWEDEEDEAE